MKNKNKLINGGLVGVGKYFALGDDELETIIKINEEDSMINIINDIKNVKLNLNIDKSWGGLAFLLNNSKICKKKAENFSIPLVSMKEIKSEKEVLFYSTKKEIEAAYRFLKTIDIKTLKSEYDFKDFINYKIYPLKEDDDSEFYFDYLIENLEAITRYYKKIIENDMNILFIIEQ